MKTRFIATCALLALCLVGSAAYAGDPFSVTCQLVEPGIYEYTLYNNGVDNELVWALDLNWVLGWDEYADPATEFVVLAAPEDLDWFTNDYFPWPAFDDLGPYPAPGESVSGFLVQSSQPAAYFLVTYTNDSSSEFVGYEGSIADLTIIPEPGSIFALLGSLAGLGAFARRRK